MSKRHKPEKLLFNNLAKDFHELVSNQQALRTSVENFLNNIIDELTLGIIFDLHRKYKTNAYDLDVDESCDEGYADLESLSQHKLKKPQDCVCPNCDRAVAATHFAPHLEACMGMGRTSRLRNAARRVASNSKDRENSAYGGIASDDDDDDDADWGSRDRRKKKKDKKKGSKKNRGEIKTLFSSYFNIIILVFGIFYNFKVRFLNYTVFVLNSPSAGWVQYQ